MDPYEVCPVWEDARYLLRFVETADAPDLLRVYADPAAWPLFNADNCVDDFHYTTLEQMERAIDFWQREYRQRYYVRWTVWDKQAKQAVGTVEMFNRQAQDYFTDCGLLRLDLRSDHERTPAIVQLLSLLLPPSFETFDCRMIATKAPACAVQRRAALRQLGFTLSEEKLIGNTGQSYGDYFVLLKPTLKSEASA